MIDQNTPQPTPGEAQEKSVWKPVVTGSVVGAVALGAIGLGAALLLGNGDALQEAWEELFSTADGQKTLEGIQQMQQAGIETPGIGNLPDDFEANIAEATKTAAENSSDNAKDLISYESNDGSTLKSIASAEHEEGLKKLAWQSTNDSEAFNNSVAEYDKLKQAVERYIADNGVPAEDYSGTFNDLAPLDKAGNVASRYTGYALRPLWDITYYRDLASALYGGTTDIASGISASENLADAGFESVSSSDLGFKEVAIEKGLFPKDVQIDPKNIKITDAMKEFDGGKYADGLAKLANPQTLGLSPTQITTASAGMGAVGGAGLGYKGWRNHIKQQRAQAEQVAQRQQQQEQQAALMMAAAGRPVIAAPARSWQQRIAQPPLPAPTQGQQT